MYCLTDFCCICFYNKKHLQLLSDSNGDNITYFFKLTFCIPEMCFNGINDQRFVCKKCCKTLDTVYMFRQRCLRSKTTLTEYISQLHQISQISGTATVSLTDVNKFADIKKEYTKEENFQTNPITEFKTENNPTILKLIETGHNFIQLGNVIIKMEREDENSEDDNILINQDESKIDVSQNYVKITASIKKENENQDFEEQERFESIMETIDSENDYIVIKEKENNDFLYSEKCTDDFSTNLDEIKIDIVDNDIELANEEIDIKYKIEDIEKFSTEVNVIPLEDQVKDKADKEAYFIHKPLEGKQKEISLMKMPKQQKKCGVVDKKMKIVKNHRCTVCKKKFSRLDHVKGHMMIHTGVKPHECSLCNKKFTHSSSLKEHFQIHTGVKRHKCSVCQKKFTNSSTLRHHLNIHSGVKPYKCSVCQQKFNQSHNLKKHMRIHSGLKPHECSVCKKKFADLSYLKAHFKMHSGIKPYECQVCQKKFVYLSSLNHHLKNHSGEKEHECSVCKIKFAQASSLKQHLNIHSGIKQHECQVCKKKYNQSYNLSRHMKSHSGLKPHECSVCKKKFADPYNLKIHSKIHSGVKSHECSVCQKKFTHPSNLKQHLKIHSGVKEHECSVCQRKFNHSSHLKRHMLIHTGVKQHECSVCKKKFTDSSNLKAHCKKMHTGVKHEYLNWL